jgi:hypothetical protein
MDLIISSVWGIVGLVAAAFASVFAALARCAIAEVVVRAAARLHTDDEEVRAELVEEWLRVLQDMRPSERPGHAATLLWSGLKSRRVTTLPSRRDRVTLSMITQMSAYFVGDREWSRVQLWWWQVKFLVRPLPFDVISDRLRKFVTESELLRAGFEEQFRRLDGPGADTDR